MNESIMHKEILMIPESLKLTKEYNKEKIVEFCKAFKEKDIKNVMIAARGSSDNVGVYLKYLFEIYLHIPVSFASCSVITKYSSYLNFDKTLVIGISQSGSGEDIFEFLNMAKNHNALTLTITNNTESIVAKVSEYHFYLNLTKELGLAATKTFISQMYICLLLVNELLENKDLTGAINSLDELTKKVIANEETIKEVAIKCVEFNDCYLLSRGLNYVSSLEGALKIQETTYIKAKAYASSDFYHGPMAIVDEKQNLFLLNVLGKVSDDNHVLYEKLLELNPNIIVISNDPYFENAKSLIKIPYCEEVISPFLIIITIQLLACNLSIYRGIDVDHPRNLKKVTVTR